MSKKSTHFQESPVIEAIERLVAHMLENNVSPYELSFSLTAVATDLGLKMAPTAEQALEVVADAIRRTVATHASADSRVRAGGEADASVNASLAVDPKRHVWRVH